MKCIIDIHLNGKELLQLLEWQQVNKSGLSVAELDIDMMVSIDSPEAERILGLHQDDWLTILDNMDNSGGSFVIMLSNMARRADVINRRKCVYTWLPYFIQYEKF